MQFGLDVEDRRKQRFYIMETFIRLLDLPYEALEKKLYDIGVEIEDQVLANIPLMKKK